MFSPLLFSLGIHSHGSELVVEMRSLDTSDWMRNGDYSMSRIAAQYEAASLYIGTKMQMNPQTSIGVLTYGGRKCVEAFVLSRKTGVDRASSANSTRQFFLFLLATGFSLIHPHCSLCLGCFAMQCASGTVSLDRFV